MGTAMADDYPQHTYVFLFVFLLVSYLLLCVCESCHVSDCIANHMNLGVWHLLEL